MKDKKLNIVEEPVADYEKAELDLLKNALNHSCTERFQMMTTLMKMNQMFRKAKITHQPKDQIDILELEKIKKLRED